MVTDVLLAIVIGVCVTAAALLYHARNLTPLYGWLDTNELGIVERDIRNLKEVAIILDKIEEPFYLLKDAVLENFSQGTVYRFFVSAENFELSFDKFKPFFDGLVEEAARVSGQVGRNLCHIYRLPHARRDYPYIFYCYSDENSTENLPVNIIGFRGSDIGKGIAEKYRRLEPVIAFTLLSDGFATQFQETDAHLPIWMEHLLVAEFTRQPTPALLQDRPRQPIFSLVKK